MILAVNMTDTLKKRGLSLDCRRLSALLGIPVIPICALSGDGLGLLTEAARREARSVSPPPARTFADDAEAYAFISSILDQCLSGEDSAKARTDRADRVLCHPVLGRIFFIQMCIRDSNYVVKSLNEHRHNHKMCIRDRPYSKRIPSLSTPNLWFPASTANFLISEALKKASSYIIVVAEESVNSSTPPKTRISLLLS